MPLDQYFSSGGNSGPKTIKDLIKSQGIIKGRLTRINDYVSLLNTGNIGDISNLKLKELKLRSNKIENLLF